MQSSSRENRALLYWLNSLVDVPEALVVSSLEELRDGRVISSLLRHLIYVYRTRHDAESSIPPPHDLRSSLEVCFLGVGSLEGWWKHEFDWFCVGLQWLRSSFGTDLLPAALASPVCADLIEAGDATGIPTLLNFIREQLHLATGEPLEDVFEDSLRSMHKAAAADAAAHSPAWSGSSRSESNILRVGEEKERVESTKKGSNILRVGEDEGEGRKRSSILRVGEDEGEEEEKVDEVKKVGKVRRKARKRWDMPAGGWNTSTVVSASSKPKSAVYSRVLPSPDGSAKEEGTGRRTRAGTLVDPSWSKRVASGEEVGVEAIRHEAWKRRNRGETVGKKRMLCRIVRGATLGAVARVVAAAQNRLAVLAQAEEALGLPLVSLVLGEAVTNSTQIPSDEEDEAVRAAVQGAIAAFAPQSANPQSATSTKHLEKAAESAERVARHAIEAIRLQVVLAPSSGKSSQNPTVSGKSSQNPTTVSGKSPQNTSSSSTGMDLAMWMWSDAVTRWRAYETDDTDVLRSRRARGPEDEVSESDSEDGDAVIGGFEGLVAESKTTTTTKKATSQKVPEEAATEEEEEEEDPVVRRMFDGDLRRVGSGVDGKCTLRAAVACLENEDGVKEGVAVVSPWGVRAAWTSLMTDGALAAQIAAAVLARKGERRKLVRSRLSHSSLVQRASEALGLPQPSTTVLCLPGVRVDVRSDAARLRNLECAISALRALGALSEETLWSAKAIHSGRDHVAAFRFLSDLVPSSAFSFSEETTSAQMASSAAKLHRTSTSPSPSSPLPSFAVGSMRSRPVLPAPWRRILRHGARAVAAKQAQAAVVGTLGIRLGLPTPPSSTSSIVPEDALKYDWASSAATTTRKDGATTNNDPVPAPTSKKSVRWAQKSSSPTTTTTSKTSDRPRRKQPPQIQQPSTSSSSTEDAALSVANAARGAPSLALAPKRSGVRGRGGRGGGKRGGRVPLGGGRSEKSGWMEVAEGAMRMETYVRGLGSRLDRERRPIDASVLRTRLPRRVVVDTHLVSGGQGEGRGLERQTSVAGGGSSSGRVSFAPWTWWTRDVADWAGLGDDVRSWLVSLGCPDVWLAMRSTIVPGEAAPLPHPKDSGGASTSALLDHAVFNGYGLARLLRALLWRVRAGARAAAARRNFMAGDHNHNHDHDHPEMEVETAEMMVQQRKSPAGVTAPSWMPVASIPAPSSRPIVDRPSLGSAPRPLFARPSSIPEARANVRDALRSLSDLVDETVFLASDPNRADLAMHLYESHAGSSSALFGLQTTFSGGSRPQNNLSGGSRPQNMASGSVSRPQKDDSVVVSPRSRPPSIAEEPYQTPMEMFMWTLARTAEKARHDLCTPAMVEAVLSGDSAAAWAVLRVARRVVSVAVPIAPLERTPKEEAAIAWLQTSGILQSARTRAQSALALPHPGYTLGRNSPPRPSSKPREDDSIDGGDVDTNVVVDNAILETACSGWLWREIAAQLLTESWARSRADLERAGDDPFPTPSQPISDSSTIPKPAPFSSTTTTSAAPITSASTSTQTPAASNSLWGLHPSAFQHTLQHHRHLALHISAAFGGMHRHWAGNDWGGNATHPSWWLYARTQQEVGGAFAVARLGKHLGYGSSSGGDAIRKAVAGSVRAFWDRRLGRRFVDEPLRPEFASRGIADILQACKGVSGIPWGLLDDENVSMAIATGDISTIRSLLCELHAASVHARTYEPPDEYDSRRRREVMMVSSSSPLRRSQSRQLMSPSQRAAEALPASFAAFDIIPSPAPPSRGGSGDEDVFPGPLAPASQQLAQASMRQGLDLTRGNGGGGGTTLQNAEDATLRLTQAASAPKHPAAALADWLREEQHIELRQPWTLETARAAEFTDGLVLCLLADRLRRKRGFGTLTGVDRAPATAAAKLQNIRRALASLRQDPKIPVDHLWSEHAIREGSTAVILPLLHQIKRALTK